MSPRDGMLQTPLVGDFRHVGGPSFGVSASPDLSSQGRLTLVHKILMFFFVLLGKVSNSRQFGASKMALTKARFARSRKDPRTGNCYENKSLRNIFVILSGFRALYISGNDRV